MADHEAVNAAMPARPIRIVFFNWRDTSNPEGGGSEVYVESIATAMANAGHDVTIVCAAYDGAASDEVVNGVRFVRGGSKLGVYREARKRYRRGDLGNPDVVVDVQNGIPFFTHLTRRQIPTIVLVHHVHREQWPVVYDPVRARIGWTIESSISPRIHRGCQYVAVSESTRRELIELGVRADDITVVRNGTTVPAAAGEARTSAPRVIVLGRIVPHKRVELAVDAVVAASEEFPDITLSIVGEGWWRPELERYVAENSPLGMVRLTGHVDDATKQAELSAASVMLLPSLKEGWGIVVMEAAQHGVPTIAFWEAGGVQESIMDGVTGALVDTPDEMATALCALLRDRHVREEMARAAQIRASLFNWEASAAEFAAVVSRVLGRPVSVEPVPKDYLLP